MTKGVRVALAGVLGLGLLAGPVGATPADAASSSGLTWSALSPPRSPPALVGAVAAYDPADSTIVVFGGRLADGQLSDQTWVWNGSGWTQPVLYGASPAPRQGTSMAFDTALDPPQLILFGGRGADGALLDDTWTWNGSSWNQVSTATAPGGRAGAAMSEDGAGQLVVFGGYGTASLPALSGSTTTIPATKPTISPTTTSPATSPTPSSTRPSTTTVPAPTTATTTPPTTAPSPATTGSGAPGPALSPEPTVTATTAPPSPPLVLSALEADRQSVSTPQVLDDTWVLTQSNGADGWRHVATATHPPPTTDASLVSGPSGRSLLFGGSAHEPGANQTAGTTNRTWLWNGRAWSEADTGPAPAARQDAGLAYDADLGATVLFGGLGPNGTFGDTWLWSGSAWRHATPASPPSARSGAATAYDPDSRQLVTFGGADGSGAALSSTEVLTAHAPTRISAPAATPSTGRGAQPGGRGHAATTTTTTTTARGAPAPTGTTVPTTGPARHAATATKSRPVRRGDLVTLTGAGFVPRADITITFHSLPVTVGRARADAAGSFVTAVEVPIEAAFGNHHFEASGLGPDGPTSLMTPVQVVRLATAHHTSTATMVTLLGIAAAIPLLSWAGLGAAGRRRRPVTG